MQIEIRDFQAESENLSSEKKFNLIHMRATRSSNFQLTSLSQPVWSFIRMKELLGHTMGQLIKLTETLRLIYILSALSC